MESTQPNAHRKSPVSFSALEWLISNAVSQHKAGKWEEAIAFYLEAIESKSEQPPWLYSNTITLLSQLDRFEEGLALGKQALTIHSESSEVYRALGILDERQGDFANCINRYQQAIAFEAQQPDWLYCNLAKQLLERERVEEALEVALKGTQLYPGFHPLHYVLGNALGKSGQWEQAISSYLRVQQLNPNWVEVEQKLNQAIYRKSQTERLIHHHQDRPIVGAKMELNPDTVEQNLQPRDELEERSELDFIFDQIQDKQLSLSDCHQIWQDVSSAGVDLNYGCWLSPSILYLEATVNSYWMLNEAKLLVCSDTQYAIAAINFFQISEQHIIGVACFENNVYTANYDSYRLCINDKNSPIFIEGEISKKAYNLEFIDYLKGKPKDQKHLIRESLSSSIIKLIPQNQKPQGGDLLKKLQCFLEIPAVNYVDPNLPFKIFIDYIIPLKYDGLFISGWLQDPYEMLEGITAVSALGFSLELSNQDIYRLERHDVNQFLQDTRYGDFQGKLGFCAYAPVPKEINQSIQDFAELHSFRFLVRLKGNIEIEIIPDAKYSDYYNARQRVMQIANPDEISETMIANCIAPAGLKLQQLCIEQVGIESTTMIGTPVEQPLISIIIPLYRRLDFMKVQVATMANDPDIKQCEIIYVLDSPEQEEELRNFLLNHCTLYELPVKLVIMKRNSGYGAANNAGASQATGKYLLLLNSDVFAKTKGWMTKMAQFYADSPQIGALGAKLLYEDGSLQHAGMFFARTTFPFWLTLHYYKGLPGNYDLAKKTRPVPAVTGACLMISKELYERVGGLTTDYIIGDFEDSDLCFKCRELGYESWYFADATLYHLERQSVPLNSSYNGSLAWQLNGRLHQERWGQQITQIMNSTHN